MYTSQRRIGWVLTIIAALVAPAVAWQDPPPGVVVEKITKNLAADKAGVLESDTILSWTHNGLHGEVGSPFDLSTIEIDQAPRGTVTLSGLRGGELRSWTLNPTDNWGL